MKLYIVATPIGNLEDITFRAIETLKKVDHILCEDTRITSRLLQHYAIKKPLISYHQRSKDNKVEKIIKLLEQGESLALVTDAGTPGISDPGNELVAKVREEFNDLSKQGNRESKYLELEIIPIPGVTALTTLASVAGINLQKFVFMGFPPNKKGRQTFFNEAANNIEEKKYPVFYYDSPYRVVKNFELLQKSIANAKIIVGRELTKKFEEIKIGKVEKIIEYYKNNINKRKGEFVILITN